MKTGVAFALLSAVLFGASTPFAKLLVGHIPPVMLAGVLYLGSGLGLAVWLAVRRLARTAGDRSAPIVAHDWPWLGAAILAGGVLGPVLLMFGLQHTDGGAAVLLLNLESVLTAALAWLVFRENVDRRIFLGMLAIVAGGVLLSWEQAPKAAGVTGPLLIALACLAWAIDNNLTRKVSGGDAATIACLKGLAAGAVTVAIALALHATAPGASQLLAAGLVGFFGYGVSLTLFVMGLRHLGAARTGAYFSTAPFVGALVAVVLLSEQPGVLFWAAGGLMAFGVWLHLTEHHEHEHAHREMEHIHAHEHDEHHQHAHTFAWDGHEPHTHPHRHAPFVHSHPHFPDLHHQHRH